MRIISKDEIEKNDSDVHGTQTILNQEAFRIDSMNIPYGQSSNVYSGDQKKICFVVSGMGRLKMDGRESKVVAAGDIVLMASGEIFRFLTDVSGSLSIKMISLPALGPDDIGQD